MPKRRNAEEVGRKRGSVSFALTPEVNAAVAAWIDRNGGSKTKLLERLVRFFANAPESVQQLMVGNVPEDMRKEFGERAVEYFVDERNAADLRSKPAHPVMR